MHTLICAPFIFLKYSFVCLELECVSVLFLKQPLQDIFLPYPIIVSRGIDLVKCQEILGVVVLNLLERLQLTLHHLWLKRGLRHLVIGQTVLGNLGHEVYFAAGHGAHVYLVAPA